jgi:hypothetical protein
MWAPAIIEVEVTANRRTGLADAVVGSQIHLLVLDAAPQPLDEYVVAPGALTSMLMAMTFLRSTPVNAEPVNWLP